MANNPSSYKAVSKLLELTQTQGGGVNSNNFLILGDIPVRFQLEQQQSKGKESNEKRTKFYLLVPNKVLALNKSQKYVNVPVNSHIVN